MNANEVLKGLLALPTMEQVAVLAGYARAINAVSISVDYPPDSDHQIHLERMEANPHPDSFAFADRIGNIAQHYEWPDGFKNTIYQHSVPGSGNG